ncbi:hypothetical protein HDA40_005588 [Hamadaea flava]|uniref:Tat pathway signal sequence domain protein n=1 Tax=Hamadaea flava TaxID=1742688 RepID=A0ABV8LSR4_9ACTN|nr:hypothetical protein [Hamadaea flava]MCP2327081.1 hypothetical protein [Hamadaea flava]
MTIDEERFAASLHDLADREAPATSAATQVVRRAQRARRLRTALVSTTAVAVVGVLGVVATAVAGVGGGPSGGSGAGGLPAANATRTTEAQPASPALRLVAAAKATSQTSFAFTAKVHVLDDDRGKKSSHDSTYVGAFDPRLQQGFIRNPKAKWGELRIVDGFLYQNKADFWIKRNGLDVLVYLVDAGSVGLLNPMVTADFMEQMTVIQKEGEVASLGTSGSGDATVERYAFSATIHPTDSDEPKSVPISGTAEVNLKSGLISKIAYESTFEWRPDDDPKSAYFRAHYTAEWIYSDFGLAVNVEIPANIRH